MGQRTGIWLLARVCSSPTNVSKQLRRLSPLTHVLSPRGARLGWKGLAKVQPLIGSLCAEHNPTPVTDALQLLTELKKEMPAK